MEFCTPCIQEGCNQTVFLKAPPSCRTDCDRPRRMGGDKAVPVGWTVGVEGLEMLQSELMRNICSTMRVMTEKQDVHGDTQGQPGWWTDGHSATSRLSQKWLCPSRPFPGLLVRDALGSPSGHFRKVLSGESESPVATGTQMSPHTAGWSQEDLVAQKGRQLGIWTWLG